MSCDEIRQKILDGNWDEQRLKEAETVLGHLQQCGPCRTALADYGQIQSLLQVPENKSEPNGGWLAIENRIVPSRKFVSFNHWKPRIALAASILFVFILGSLYWWSVQKPEAMRLVMPEVAQYSSKDIARQVAIFDQVSQVFEGKAGWVAVSEKTSDVGMVPDRILPKPQLLLLRLTMSQKGKVVSQADLIIIPGQTAELKVPFHNDQELKYRIRTTPDEHTSLTVWVEVERPNQDGEVIAALATTLHVKPGEVRSAGQMVTSTGEYELKIAFSKAKTLEGK